MVHYTNIKAGLKDLRFNFFPYHNDSIILNEVVLFDLVDQFVDQVLSKLDNPVKVMLTVCSKESKDRRAHYYNLTKLIVVTKDNARSILKESFKYRLDIVFNNYQGAELEYLGLTWGELTYADGTAIPYIPTTPSPYTGEVSIDTLTNTSRINLPPTMDLSKWTGYEIIVDGKKEKTLRCGDYTYIIRIRGSKQVTHYISIYNNTLTIKLDQVTDKSLPRVLNTEGYM
jgi:hypothetical protein